MIRDLRAARRLYRNARDHRRKDGSVDQAQPSRKCIIGLRRERFYVSRRFVNVLILRDIPNAVPRTLARTDDFTSCLPQMVPSSQSANKFQGISSFSLETAICTTFLTS